MLLTLQVYYTYLMCLLSVTNGVVYLEWFLKYGLLGLSGGEQGVFFLTGFFKIVS